MGEELVLELRHVDVRRALRLAGLALEAEVHHLVEPPAGEVRGRHPTRQHRAEGVGAPPRRVLLVPGRHVRGAHGALERLPADADAVAHLHRRREPPLGREVEQRGRRRGRIARAVAEVLGEPRAVHDVAGVQEVPRVERALEVPVSLEDPGSVHPLEEGAPGPAVPVLARDRAAVLEHQLGDLARDRADLREAARGLEVDDGTDVQAPDGAVAVVGGGGAVTGQDRAEARHELGEVLGVDGRVLDEGDRLPVPLHPEEEPEPGLAELPDRLLLGRVEDDVRRVAEALPFPALPERLEPGPHRGLVLARVLDDQDGGGVALDEAHAARLLEVAAGEVEDHLVRQLDGVGLRVEDRLRGLERLLQLPVVDHAEPGPPGAEHQAHLRLDDRQQRALGPDGEAGQVERPVGHELGQVVAGDAPPVSGVAGTDLLAVFPADARHLAMDLAEEARRRGAGAELVEPELTQHGLGAVGEEHAELEHVVDGEAVGDRVGAARIVAEHPTEGRPVRRRGVRSEEEAVRADQVIQLVLHEPRLHARPPLLGIQLEETVHVRREVDDDRPVDGLAGQRGPAAAGQHRRARAVGHVEDGLDVARVARDHHAHRFHLVHRGVGGVEEPRVGVEADVALDDLA